MMDKSYQSSGESGSNSNRDQYLKHLNKISHKIAKPIRRPPPPFDHHHHQQLQQSLQPQQPPVYNINKSDFRDVVQKLTGSPAHDRFATPPPIHPPKPPSSRLQRIRPPPLPLHNAGIPPLPTTATAATSLNSDNNNWRPVSPLSPLPPFPAVHAAAESPISAYMKYLQSSISTGDSESKRFSGLSPLAPLVSPRWNNSNLWQSQQTLFPSPKSAMAPATSQFPMPSSPLAFGRLQSPRSPYPLLSPSLLFSPSTGQFGFPQFPPSPRLPLLSPRWRDF